MSEYRDLFPGGSTLDRLHRDPPDALGLYHDTVHGEPWGCGSALPVTRGRPARAVRQRVSQ